jgi:hypothetical protein
MGGILKLCSLSVAHFRIKVDYYRHAFFLDVLFDEVCCCCYYLSTLLYKTRYSVKYVVHLNTYKDNSSIWIQCIYRYHVLYSLQQFSISNNAFKSNSVSKSQSEVHLCSLVIKTTGDSFLIKVFEQSTQIQLFHSVISITSNLLACIWLKNSFSFLRLFRQEKVLWPELCNPVWCEVIGYKREHADISLF